MDSNNDSVQIQLDIPIIKIENYAPEQQTEWRLTVDIRRMLIDDYVKTSHNAKLLTFSRQKSKDKTCIKLWVEQNYKGSYKFKVMKKF